MSFTFRVYGTPAPQGSKRHVGNGVMVESSAKVKPWREAVKYAALERAGVGWVPFSGPVAVEVTFYMPRPKSARDGDLPWKRPDLEKLQRSTADAITDAGVWKDDAQAVEYFALKRYAEDGTPAGAEITIWPL